MPRSEIGFRLFLSGIIELEIEKMKNTKKYLFVHSAHSVLLLAQEIFEEILRGNKAGSSFCRDKPTVVRRFGIDAPSRCRAHSSAYDSPC